MKSRDKVQELALASAIRLHEGESTTTQDVLGSASLIAAWLRGDARHLTLSISPLTYSQAGSQAQPTRLIMTGVNSMAVTMNDTDYFTLSVNPADSKGAPTTDSGPFTWTEDSGGTVVTLQASADGTQANVIAGTPGSANVTVTDANGLTGVEAVTVTAGSASALGLTASTPAPVPAGGTQPPAGTGV